MNLNFTIFFSLLLLCNSVPSNGLITSCITTYNETGLINDPFRANVLSLFTAFTSSSSSFFNTTVGDSPDKAYGLYLCRGDTDKEACRSCISSLTSTWATTLRGCKEGVAFMDHCMARYANYSIFGKADDSIRGVQMGKRFANANSNASRDFNMTMEGVLELAAKDTFESRELYSASVTYYGLPGKEESVYVLAQCTPDIDMGDCCGCLLAAQSYIRANVTRAAKSGWALLPSCQLRYDTVRFFGDTPAGSSSAMPSTSSFLSAIFSLLFVLG